MKAVTPAHETAKPKSKCGQNPAALQAEHLKRDQIRASLRWGNSEMQTLPLEARCSWSVAFFCGALQIIWKNRLCSRCQPDFASHFKKPTLAMGGGQYSHLVCVETASS